MSNDIEVQVGRIGRAHGLRGEVGVRPSTDFVDRRFAPGATLRSEAGPLVVVGHRWHQGFLLVAFEGVTDRSAAEALRGRELWVTGIADDLVTDDDEFHDHQLVGLEVRPVGGAETVGRVREVRHLPSQDLLIVTTPDGERMIPFVTELVPRVDVAGGYLEVVPLPGLLDDPEEAEDAD